MRIGILGAESKHVEYLGKPINNERLFGSRRVEAIWGGDTTRERLKICAEEVGIENILNTASEVIDCCDAVIITLRNGGLHAKYALECINKHIPVFIDKPFTCNSNEALSILNAAARTGTPFTGGSTLCFLPEIAKLRVENLKTPYTELSYLADPFSPFGGWYYYGSHLTDLCAAICGIDASFVKAGQVGSEVFVDVIYPCNARHKQDGQGNSLSEHKKVRIYSAPDLTNPKVTMDETTILNDKICYNYGLRAFFDIIATGISPDGERLLFSVRLMDAIMRSLLSGEEAAIRR